MSQGYQGIKARYVRASDWAEALRVQNEVDAREQREMLILFADFFANTITKEWLEVWVQAWKLWIVGTDANIDRGKSEMVLSSYINGCVGIDIAKNSIN